MAVLVQKYGGTSVGDAEKIAAVAQRVAGSRAEGNQIAVVVSAMGKSTDELISLAQSITQTPEPRELDILLSTGEIVSSTHGRRPGRHPDRRRPRQRVHRPPRPRPGSP
jgi:aspartate kinase